MITPEDYISPDLPAELLFEERHVVVGCNRSLFCDGTITQSQFLAAGHVNVSIGNEHVSSYADKALEVAGVIRRIEVTAPSFSAVPVLLENTNRLAIMHERLAKAMAVRYDLVMAPVPFHLAPLREMVQYHIARTKDGGLIWLRDQLQQVLAAESK